SHGSHHCSPPRPPRSARMATSRRLSCGSHRLLKRSAARRASTPASTLTISAACWSSNPVSSGTRTMSFPPEADFRYHRIGNVLHVVTKSVTNHEMRNILIGFWLTLDEADRRDHIKELQHYLEPGSRPPGAAVEMAQAIVAERNKA